MRPGSRRSSLRTSLLVWLLGGVVLVGVGRRVRRVPQCASRRRTPSSTITSRRRRSSCAISRSSISFRRPFHPAMSRYDFVVQIWTVDGRRIYIGPEQAVLPNSTALGYLHSQLQRRAVAGVRRGVAHESRAGGAAHERPPPARQPSWRCVRWRLSPCWCRCWDCSSGSRSDTRCSRCNGWRRR